MTTISFFAPAVGISPHTCGRQQHCRAEEPHTLSLSLLRNSPPPWPNGNGPVTRRAFISCFHTGTGCLWVTWTPTFVGIIFTDGQDISYVCQSEKQNKTP